MTVSVFFAASVAGTSRHASTISLKNCLIYREYLKYIV